jgi:hypothetical protein
VCIQSTATTVIGLTTNVFNLTVYSLRSHLGVTSESRRGNRAKPSGRATARASHKSPVVVAKSSLDFCCAGSNVTRLSLYLSLFLTYFHLLTASRQQYSLSLPRYHWPGLRKELVGITPPTSSATTGEEGIVTNSACGNTYTFTPYTSLVCDNRISDTLNRGLHKLRGSRLAGYISDRA